jgi:hypothetical protein
MPIDENASMFTDAVRAQLTSECQTMIRAALADGLKLPGPVLEIVGMLDRRRPDDLDLSTLAALYGHLAAMMAPATPAGLRMLQEDQRLHPRLHLLGPLPSIRYLMLAAMVFSLVFFGVSLLSEIKPENLAKDIYGMSGLKLMYVLIFLLSASGLGATFGVLFDAYDLVTAGRYDTTYDSLYWTRIGLGLVSGLMLAELLPQAANGGSLERPLLALLGGFSASVVHRILQRLSGLLEGLFTPESKPEPGGGYSADRGRLAVQPNTHPAVSANVLVTAPDANEAGAPTAARTGLTV